MVAPHPFIHHHQNQLMQDRKIRSEATTKPWGQGLPQSRKLFRLMLLNSYIWSSFKSTQDHTWQRMQEITTYFLHVVFFQHAFIVLFINNHASAAAKVIFEAASKLLEIMHDWIYKKQQLTLSTLLSPTCFDDPNQL